MLLRCILMLICTCPLIMNGQNDHHRNEITRLTKQADEIVVGTVDTVFSKWNDTHTSIFTYVAVTASETNQAQPERSQLTIRTLGGRIGNIVQWVSSPQATFGKNERFLAFLVKKDAQSKNFSVVQGVLGKLTIECDGSPTEVVFRSTRTGLFSKQDHRAVPLDTLKRWVSEAKIQKGG